MKISTIERLAKSIFDCNVANFNKSKDKEVLWTKKTIIYSVFILGGNLRDLSCYFGITRQEYILSTIKWYVNNLNKPLFKEKTLKFFKELNNLIDNESIFQENR